MERLVESVRYTRLAADAAEILLPGEPEWRRREENLRDGVALNAGRGPALDDFAAEHEIGVPGLDR